jgi:nucleosome assembly protein 1-like 1
VLALPRFAIQDIRSEVLVGEERGFKLTFHFKADNPHFTNSVRQRD